MSDIRTEGETLRVVDRETTRSVAQERRPAGDELTRALDELAREAEWHRVTLASIGDAVVTTDTQGNVLTLNGVAESLTGWTQDEARGRPLNEVFVTVNEDRQTPAENPARTALEEGRVVGLVNHTLLIARDGSETPIDDSAAPIRDEQGTVHGVVLVFRSIAERREAERALRESERELADFFEHASVGLHWVGPDGTILRVNKAELDMLGFTRDEYVGHNIAEFHVDQDDIQGILNRLAHGEILGNVEARMRCKDGSIRDVLIDSSVLWDEGRFIHTRCFTRDITDLKRADEVQSRLAAIVESSQDAIISKTLDGHILSWNAGAQHLFGYAADETIGKSVTMLIPADRRHEEGMILERLRRGERIETYETVRVSKLGEYLDVSLTLSPIRDRGGRVVAISKIARDVTARRRVERRLRAQNEVARVLAESDDLQTAAPVILRHICELVQWQVASLWLIQQNQLMRCVCLYHSPSVSVPGFEAATRELAFERGSGLPGRIWESGRPVWVTDVTAEPDFPRGPMAAADGLHSAFALPIAVNDDLLGMIEFFSNDVRQRDEELLESMSALASQIGQFIERRRAEDALRESEERFRALADKAPVLIWLNNPDGAEFVNRSYLDFLGVNEREIEGMNWAEFVHPDDYDDYVGGYVQAVERRTLFQREFRFRRADGVYRYMKTVGVPRFASDGSFLGYIGSTYDITDVKRAEQTTSFLASASAALADLTDYDSTLQKVAALAVPRFADWCAIDLLQRDGSLRRVAMTHADPGKVGYMRELERKYPPRTSNIYGTQQVIRTGQPQWASTISDEMLATITQDDEHLRLVRELGFKSYICVPLRSRMRVLGVMTFVGANSGRVYDVNDLRAAEDLAHRAVIAIENATLLGRLKEADRHKDEFLAMLAHELRNPLAPIRNAVQILRLLGPRAPEVSRATDMIERQTLQMTRLVDDLLDVSRITRGKIELRKETVDLAAVVRNAVDATQPLIDRWRHQLTVSLPPEPITLEADPARLEQVLANLLNNAAKYTNQGGHIELSARVEGGTVSVRVKDDGIGIPEGMQQRIFDLFTQVDRSLERSEGGLGIGLTLVQRLVELHGGYVEVFSAGPGTGSEFTVTLPVTTGATPEVPHAATVRVPTPSPRRVLIVDNNRDAADSLATLLRLSGNHVDTVYDGLEALKALPVCQPDVVLIDIGLPTLNGYEVARRIRALEGSPRKRLIALTGWGQEEDRRRSREAGFDEHLTKPVEFAVLQRILSESEDGRGKRA